MVKAGGDNVTFRLRSGKLRTIPQTKLSLADQNLVLLTLEFGPGGTPNNK